MTAQAAIFAAWFVWAASWVAAAVWANPTVKRPGINWRNIYRVPEVLGFVLLLGFFGRVSRGDHGIHVHEISGVPLLWQVPDQIAWTMVGVATGGFLFAWWARIHLGRLWSGNVTRKEGHRVVDTGPYRIVRHPIYTGILIAAAATTILRGTPAALAGATLLLIGFWIKAGLEEQFLRSELGAQAYDAYARKTAMLIPFVRL